MSEKTIDRVEDIILPGERPDCPEARLRFTIYREDWAGVDVVCHEACGWGDDGPMFYDPNDNSEAGARLFSAWIKWDGCSHFNFGEGEGDERTDGYLHLCGREGYDVLARCLVACWNHARRLMTNGYCRDTYAEAGQPAAPPGRPESADE